MIDRIFGFLKSGMYAILYGSRVRFANIPSMRRGARIKSKSGYMSFGRDFSMNCGAYCAAVNGGKINVGDHVSINCNTIVVAHNNITIGSGCSIAPNVLIYDHDHKFGAEGICSGYNTAPVVIEKNCWIGANVIILRGTHIGEGCVIGAGCVVKGDIPPHSLVTSERKLTIQPIQEK